MAVFFPWGKSRKNTELVVWLADLFTGWQCNHLWLYFWKERFDLLPPLQQLTKKHILTNKVTLKTQCFFLGVLFPQHQHLHGKFWGSHCKTSKRRNLCAAVPCGSVKRCWVLIIEIPWPLSLEGWRGSKKWRGNWKAPCNIFTYIYCINIYRYVEMVL